MKFTLNGKTVTYEGDASMPILWYLRDIKGLTGTKYGCVQSLCGACTIHLDGDPVRACVTPMQVAENRELTTIEGLSADGQHPLQQAWVEENVPQCGYCQAGQIMQAAALLASNPTPDDDAINDAMSGNICRCGTYVRIRSAIKSAAGKM